MYDGSLRCQTKRAGQIVSSSRDYSCELVSPILTYDEDINNLQEIVKLLRKAGGFTNPTCGIHLHLNGADHDVRTIRNFINIIASKNDLLYKALELTEITDTTLDDIIYAYGGDEEVEGDALLQKTYVSDFLMHKTKKNNGEIPQYYVHDSHPAIVTKEDWDLVQIEMKRRKQIGRKYQSSNSCFSSKLICEDCGAFYGQKL